MYSLSLHDALPICPVIGSAADNTPEVVVQVTIPRRCDFIGYGFEALWMRSEEHTSELQSHRDVLSFPTRRSSDLSGHRLSCGQHAGSGRAGHHPSPL